MKRRVEGERDEGNTHLVQDTGSDWPNTKGNEKGKKEELLGAPQFRQPRRFFRPVYVHRTGRREEGAYGFRLTAPIHMLSTSTRGRLF